MLFRLFINGLFCAILMYPYFNCLAGGNSQLRCNDKNCQRHLQLALDLYKNSDYKRAIVEFQETYKINRDPRILYNIGRIYQKLRQHEEAINWYNISLREATQDKELYDVVNLSILELTKEKQQPNLAHRLAVIEPRRCTHDLTCRGYLDRGVKFDLAQKYEQALQEFQAAYKQQEDPRLAINIGRTLHKLGRFAEALSWYRVAGRAAPADTELQKQLQEFTAQAKQNLPEKAEAHAPVSVVNQPTFAVQTTSVNLTATAINNNCIKLDLGLPLLLNNQPMHKPLYKRASLWGPLAAIALAASAIGIAVASSPHPWQPDPQVPSSVFSVITGGAK